MWFQQALTKVMQYIVEYLRDKEGKIIVISGSPNSLMIPVKLIQQVSTQDESVSTIGTMVYMKPFDLVISSLLKGKSYGLSFEGRRTKTTLDADQVGRNGQFSFCLWGCRSYLIPPRTTSWATTAPRVAETQCGRSKPPVTPVTRKKHVTSRVENRPGPKTASQLWGSKSPCLISCWARTLNHAVLESKGLDGGIFRREIRKFIPPHPAI